jgi:hypothetical protein
MTRSISCILLDIRIDTFARILNLPMIRVQNLLDLFVESQLN